MITATLRAAAREAGLFYPPDPGSVEVCTMGGNAATNAGGMCCVKYGVTGDFVIGLEVVLADGQVMRTGRRTVKDVAGYDLTHLFVTPRAPSGNHGDHRPAGAGAAAGPYPSRVVRHPPRRQ